MTCTEEVLLFLDELADTTDDINRGLTSPTEIDWQAMSERAADLRERLAWVQGEEVPER